MTGVRSAMPATRYAIKPAPSGFLKFRILIQSINSGTYAQMAEVELLDSNGQDILVPGQVVTGQSSSYASTSYDASKLIDDSLASKWTSANGQHINSWVSFEFAEPKNIAAFSVSANSNEGYRQPKDFRLEASNDNGVSWVTLKQLNGEVNWLSNQKRTYTL